MSWVGCARGERTSVGTIGMGRALRRNSPEADVGLARHASFLNKVPEPRPRKLCF